MEDSWETGFIRSGHVLLEYKMQARAGKPWVIFLHGFGQDYRAFQPFYDVLGPAFSFLAIHLPRHGESRIDSDILLSKADWAACLERLSFQLETGPLSAVAFSMGAKFLLAAAEQKPELFGQLTLLAPDGLVMNPWYRLATGTHFGRAILKFSMLLFPLFRMVIFLLAGLGFVRPALMRFALAELGTKAGRRRVLDVWLQFRKLWPDLNTIEVNCLKNHIPVSVVLGRYDGILPLSRYSGIRKKSGWINWEILNAGHGGLIEAFAGHSLRPKMKSGNSS